MLPIQISTKIRPAYLAYTGLSRFELGTFDHFPPLLLILFFLLIFMLLISKGKDKEIISDKIFNAYNQRKEGKERMKEKLNLPISFYKWIVEKLSIQCT